ncbi:MAG: cytochrome P450 [Pseudomonadota bacterium]
MDQLTLDDIHLADMAFWQRDDRDHWFGRFRRERPVAWQPAFDGDGEPTDEGFWSLTRHADVREVSRDAKRFRSGHGTGMFTESDDEAYIVGGMLNRDPPLHTKLRRIVAKIFTPRMLQDLEASMVMRAREVIGSVSEHGACDFAADIANRMPMGVICDMLDVPEADRPHLQHLTVTALGHGDAEIGDFSNSYQAFLDLNAYGEALARARRKAPGDDLVSVLVAADLDGEKLSDFDIGIYFQLLITAGIETTASSIAQGMTFLARHPEQWRAWRENYDDLVASALEEIVRYASPVVHFGRTVAVATEIGGQAIDAGQKVVIWYNAANRDEKVFDEPDRFDIHRTPNDHVGYGGGGVHHCLGMHLARREMYHFFKLLFETMPDLDIDLDGMRPINGMFINGVRALPCTYSPTKLAS